MSAIPLRGRSDRWWLIVQLFAVLSILAWLPGNLAKLVALGAIWSVTFRYIRPPEITLFAFGCIFFSFMNVMSLDQGIFAFTHPDIFAQPVYEFFMWGFYLLHVTRMLDGPQPAGSPSKKIWTIALLYCAAFAVISDPEMLLLTTCVLLGMALFLHHEATDIQYTAYTILLGAAVEYTGVHSGQWRYPADPIGGVPLWFITLWGGVGIFLRRIAHPLLKLPIRTYR